MRKPEKAASRATELHAILAAYRHLTIGEAERGNWGDIEVELEAEIWKLEQEMLTHDAPRLSAA